MIPYNENSNIRDTYMALYPHDELANEINNVTFMELFEALDRYEDIYEFIGVYDSIIRENIFSMLAVIMDVEYEYIYDQWMKCKG
jgi:hypothetical protein